MHSPQLQSSLELQILWMIERTFHLSHHKFSEVGELIVFNVLTVFGGCWDKSQTAILFDQCATFPTIDRKLIQSTRLGTAGTCGLFQIEQWFHYPMFACCSIFMEVQISFIVKSIEQAGKAIIYAFNFGWWFNTSCFISSDLGSTCSSILVFLLANRLILYVLGHSMIDEDVILHLAKQGTSLISSTFTFRTQVHECTVVAPICIGQTLLSHITVVHSDFAVRHDENLASSSLEYFGTSQAVIIPGTQKLFVTGSVTFLIYVQVFGFQVIAHQALYQRTNQKLCCPGFMVTPVIGLDGITVVQLLGHVEGNESSLGHAGSYFSDQQRDVVFSERSVTFTNPDTNDVISISDDDTIPKITTVVDRQRRSGHI